MMRIRFGFTLIIHFFLLSIPSGFKPPGSFGGAQPGVFRPAVFTPAAPAPTSAEETPLEPAPTDVIETAMNGGMHSSSGETSNNQEPPPPMTHTQHLQQEVQRHEERPSSDQLETPAALQVEAGHEEHKTPLNDPVTLEVLSFWSFYRHNGFDAEVMAQWVEEVRLTIDNGTQ